MTTGTAAPPVPACPAGPVPVTLGTTARLRRDEVFAACQALADAGRLLVATGSHPEAEALARLSILLEGRLARPARSARPRSSGG